MPFEETEAQPTSLDDINVRSGAPVEEYLDEPERLELAPAPQDVAYQPGDSGVDYSSPLPDTQNYAHVPASSQIRYSGEELSLNFQDN